MRLNRSFRDRLPRLLLAGCDFSKEARVSLVLFGLVEKVRLAEFCGFVDRHPSEIVEPDDRHTELTKARL